MYFLFFSFFFFFFLLFFLLGNYFFFWEGFIMEILLPFSGFLDFPLVFVFDYVSFFFASFVSLISSVVFLYSKYYLNFNLYPIFYYSKRFFFLLFLFVFSMFFLVFSGSWFSVLLGWDGLGLVSFLLVIFYNNASSVDSGFITVFTNRLGDCFFILSFICMYSSGWFNYNFLLSESSFFFCFLLLLGAVTKSAQFPFSSWLPAAMAAPTPVSSLVHSSTLVTAGVYVLIRFNYILDCFYFLLFFLSLLTIIFAGVSATLEKDFKKVVAMSTLSQLGVMIFSISLGYWWLAYLHVIFHAFFKSSLFLSTGTLMHYLSGEQDSRNFGSFSISFFSKLFFFMSCLSLMGFPFFLGYFTKEMMLGCFMHSTGVIDVFCSFLFFLGGVITVSYSFRLLYTGFVFFSSFSSSFSLDEDVYFFAPIFLLYFFCVYLGNFFSFYFFPIVFFSSLECYIWIFMIFLGFSFFYFFSFSYNFMIFFTSLGFLNFFSSIGFPFLLSKMKIYVDSTWTDFFGGQGMFSLFGYMSNKFLKFFYLKFPYYFFLIFILYFLFVR